ncbi:MAG: hypothetical protein AAGA90_13960 [Actinomycetota bacterium]
MTMTDEPDSVDELISRYLDGEATDAEIARVEGDPALLARVESVRAAIEAVAAPVEIPIEALDAIRTTAIAQSTTSDQVTDLAAAAARRAERRNRVLAIAAAFVFLAVGVVAIRSLPSVSDDDDAATEAGSDDSASESASASEAAEEDETDGAEMADADALAPSSTDDADDMADDDEMADEAEMDEEQAESFEEEPEAEDDATGATDTENAILTVDVLPDELPAFDDPQPLVDLIVAEYAIGFDAESVVGDATERVFADACPVAADLAIEALDDIVSTEQATTVLAGEPTEVVVARSADGTIVVVTHPIDACDAAVVQGVVPPG